MRSRGPTFGYPSRRQPMAGGVREDETEFGNRLINLALTRGAERVMHQRPAQVRDGTYVTAIQGHAGYPDLVIITRHRWLLHAELKMPDGSMSPEQVVWADALHAATGAMYLWRPDDLDDITRVLSMPHPPVSDDVPARWLAWAGDCPRCGARAPLTPRTSAIGAHDVVPGVRCSPTGPRPAAAHRDRVRATRQRPTRGTR